MLVPVIKNGVWCVYLLLRDGASPERITNRGNRDFYVGMTNRLAARLKSHSDGKNASTRGATWRLVGAAAVHNRSEAAMLEHWLKIGDSRLKRLDWYHGSQENGYTPTEVVYRLLARARMYDMGRAIRRNFGFDPRTASIEAQYDEESHTNADR